MKYCFYNNDNTLRNGWKILGYLALAVVLIVALVSLWRLMAPGIRAWLPEPYLAFVGAVLAALVCLRLEKRPLSSIGLAWNGRFLAEAAAGLAVGAGLLALTAAAAWLMDGFHLVRSPSATAGTVLAAGAVMLGVSLFEETLFRGYIFQRAMRGIGATWALVVFALVFSAMHAGPEMTPIGAVNILLAGLMLGLAYQRTGSLALPIGLHLGWNWTQAILGFGVSGNPSKGFWTPVLHSQPEWVAGGAFGLEASAGSVVVLAAIVLALARWPGSRPAGSAALDGGETSQEKVSRAGAL